MAHDRITNLMILSYPLLAGVWQFRETAKHFAQLADPVAVRNAVLSFIEFPASETAVRRLDFNESVSNITWNRQRDATAEMMFLVACSIYENFASHLQDLVATKATQPFSGRPIEKGLQFPSYDYDFSVTPPRQVPGRYADKINIALTHLPPSVFLSSHLAPTFPNRNGRNIIDDLEMKMQTYLLFKKLRNSIAHGRFDNTIPHQFDVVDVIVTKEAQGQKFKTTISKSANGEYSINLFNVVGFCSLLLKIIKEVDFLYLISAYGEGDLIQRLSRHKDSKQQALASLPRDLVRLRLCVQSLGVHQFQATDAARSFFISKNVWR